MPRIRDTDFVEDFSLRGVPYQWWAGGWRERGKVRLYQLMITELSGSDERLLLSVRGHIRLSCCVPVPGQPGQPGQ